MSLPDELVPPATLETAPTTALPIHRNPEFRRLWAVGMLGMLIRWLEMLVYGVFTYQHTQSAFLVACMTMLRMLPMGLFGMLLGALSARISRRNGLLVSQGALLLSNLTLLLVSSTGTLEVWHLAVASFVNGTAWAADNPMRRGLIGDIAGPQRMGRAMALDALANNACRLVGPSLGGLLLASGGLPAVFTLTALLYVPVLAAVLGLSERPPTQTGPRPAIWSMLTGGLHAVRETPRLAATLCVTVIFNLFAWPVLSMVPVLGQERLHLSTQGIGLLASMDGAGALIGSIIMMAIARSSRYGHLYVGGVVVFLVMLPVFALSVHPLIAGAALMLVGMGQSGFAAMQATLVFVSASPQRRIEAMGLLTMCIGIAPVGFLTVGWLAGWLGASMAAVVCALCGLAVLGLSWPVWRLCLHDVPATQAPPPEAVR